MGAAKACANGVDLGANDADYDVAIVGASLSGSAAAILLARAGARVALIDKRPDPNAYKRVCGHFIQPTAIPTIERLGLMEAMMNAGAVRSSMRPWTSAGWIDAGALTRVPRGINLRRELLDPLIRGKAAETPGVELILGLTAHALLHEQDRISGVVLRDLRGASTRVRARLVIGADGRSSPVAKLAGVRPRVSPNGRFSYAGYFEGPPHADAPDASVWLMNLHCAGALPTDGGMTLYLCMPTKDRLPEFRADPAAALVAFVAALPNPPPIAASRMIGPIGGKLDIPNIARTPVMPGLALVGDAALSVDPLGAVGCGWAMQSAEWLADSVVPALRDGEPLARGLARYRRRHAKELRGHAFMLGRYARGRPMNSRERLMISTAARDQRVAATLEEYLTRTITPGRFLRKVLPRTIAVATRDAISSQRAGGSGRTAAQSGPRSTR